MIRYDNIKNKIMSFTLVIIMIVSGISIIVLGDIPKQEEIQSIPIKQEITSTPTTLSFESTGTLD